MKRLFIAIPLKLNNHAKQSILEIQTQLSQNSIKWVSFDNLHLTLQFLGDTNENDIETIINILDILQEYFTKFEVKLSGLYTFGNRSNPNVLWTNWIDNNQAKKLAKLLNEQISLKNTIKSDEKFIPHLTLGRIKRITDLSKFNEIISNNANLYLGKYTIDEIILFESKLKPLGPEYFALHKIKAHT
ncbi:MAG: 2,3-cyclic 3-phosphodiesterase [Rikenellaceae bacterium]|nr:2,3-cyclic 3-phosphodiesterase [Rikenellaceae bacterium]MDN5356542.1 2,3-cyclic 3-phosphodiesterase [Rikenellaceae bacterium]